MADKNEFKTFEELKQHVDAADLVIRDMVDGEAQEILRQVKQLVCD